MLGSIILALALVPLVIFVYRYWRYSPWRLTVLGRSLMWQKILFIIVLLFLVVSLFIPFRGLVREIIRVGIYLALLISFWNDVRQLLKVQHKFPHPRTEKKKTHRQSV